MPGSDAVELQRSVRERLQRAKRDLADPHAVGQATAKDIREAAAGFRELRETMPLLGECGDTLEELAGLVDGLVAQVASLKGQRGPVELEGE